MAAKKTQQTGPRAIAAHFRDAMAELESRTALVDPDPSLPRGGIRPGQWPGNPHDAMPPDCPIQVLGMMDGTVYVISATGELHPVTAWDHARLVTLFAPFTNYLYWAWPAFGKAGIDPETGEELPPRVKRVERDRAVTAIISEAGRRGIFDPSRNVRGRGGWVSASRLLWHSGDRLYMSDIRKRDAQGRATEFALIHARPGELDGYFYKRGPATLAPWMEPVGIYDSPAHQLLADLTSWNWQRPTLDPLFILGWIATGFMGAALEVRPMVFTTGGAGVGKSTLHNLIRAIFGPVLFSTANTTAAGIYQAIGQDSRPVAVDEFESRAGSFKEQAIIELARQSYSGAKLYRGGANHEGVEFELRSPFMFSAIMHPPLAVQDKTRMAILNLRQLDKGHGRSPVIPDVAGRQLLRQVMDGWEDFQRHILPKWRVVLHDVGLDARAIDTYGTLLAAAELLVGVEGLTDIGFPAGEPEKIVEMIRAATADEIADRQEKWQEVISTLLATTIDGWKGGTRQTVGQVIDDLRGHTDIGGIDEARRALALVGLGLKPPNRVCPGWALHVPHAHARLAPVFDRTDYRAGGWRQALNQAPADVVLHDLPRNSRYIAISGDSLSCSVVDLDAYLKRISPEGFLRE